MVITLYGKFIYACVSLRLMFAYISCNFDVGES